MALETALERFAPEPEAGGDGAATDTEDLRDFGGAHTLDLVHDEYGPQVPAEAGQHLIEQLADLLLLDDAFGVVAVDARAPRFHAELIELDMLMATVVAPHL